MRTEIHIDLLNEDVTVDSDKGHKPLIEGDGVTVVIAVDVGKPTDTVILLHNTKGIIEVR